MTAALTNLIAEAPTEMTMCLTDGGGYLKAHYTRQQPYSDITSPIEYGGGGGGGGGDGVSGTPPSLEGHPAVQQLSTRRGSQRETGHPRELQHIKAAHIPQNMVSSNPL